MRAALTLAALLAADLAQAQDGRAILLSVVNIDEPTLSAYLRESLTACWQASLPADIPGHFIEMTIVLSPGDPMLSARPEVRLNGLPLNQTGLVLAAVDAAIKGCALPGLSALSSAFPPEGLTFRLRAEVTGAEEQGAPVADTAMTPAERDAFRLAVSGCWSVDIGSEAARVLLVVAFELDRDGRVVGNNVELVSATDGGAGAINAAFDAARRAIIRCQTAEGYDLPEEKYESWRQVRMSFGPSGMRMQ